MKLEIERVINLSKKTYSKRNIGPLECKNTSFVIVGPSNSKLSGWFIVLLSTSFVISGSPNNWFVIGGPSTS